MNTLPTSNPQIEINNLSKVFIHKRKSLQALQEINLSIQRGETLGLVGESGCGKSTLGKIILNLESPTTGTVFFNDQEISKLPKSELRVLLQQLQLISQDPYSSLNPRWCIEDIIGEGIDIHRLANGAARKKIIVDLVVQMGLDPSILNRYPKEFSGGQRQRINIARALAVAPSFIVCDEPLSALDACTQHQVMNLLIALKMERQLSYLFISHDLHAVRQIADTVAVMYLGRIVERAPTKKLFTFPSHPYTQALLSSVPVADPIMEKSRTKILLIGDPPSPLNPPTGCPFHPRCIHALPICSQTAPPKKLLSDGHFMHCHL